MKNITFLLGILGVLLFVITTIIGGFLFPDYSHIKQLISESYAIDTEHGISLRTFGFFPSGLLLTLFGVFAIRVLPKSTISTLGFLGFTIFYGLGTVVVSLFPCDVGCNKALINPSISQVIHNLSGALTYLIVPVSIILIGIKARSWSQGNSISLVSLFCGILALSMLLFVNNLESIYIGVYQRIIEASILFWVVSCAFYIKKYNI